jgi:protoporphyrinogen oxidase
METRDVVVVGSGLAGLSAARDLDKAGYTPVVLEQAPIAGGRLRTESLRGAKMELGGVFLTHAYTGMHKLIDELGLAGDLVTPEARFNSAVLREGSWHYLNYGTARGLLGFSGIGLTDRLSVLTGGAKAIFDQTSADPGDVTRYAHLDTRSVTDAISADAANFYAAGPLEFLWGIEPHEASYALLALQLRVFHSRPSELRSGSGTLIDKLAEPLDVRCGVRVERVVESDTGVLVHAVGPDGPRVYRGRAAIIATPASAVESLWPDAPDATREFLASVHYSRIDFAYFRTREPLGRRNPSGAPLYMATIPTSTRGNRTIGGILYADHWAPTGGLVFAEAAMRSGADQLDDATLGALLQAELLELNPELAGQITGRYVGRRDPFVPIFGPGYVSRLAEFRRTLGHSAIDLAGDYLQAPWLEGALRSGSNAADRTARRLVKT